MATLKFDYVNIPIEVVTENNLIRSVKFLHTKNFNIRNTDFENLVKGENSNLGIDFRAIDENIRDILIEVSKIPYGKVTTYGDISLKVFNTKKYARFVGFALSKNPIPIAIPCHRVVSSSLSLHGFTGGLDLKEKLLSLEGVVIQNGKVDKRFLINF